MSDKTLMKRVPSPLYLVTNGKPSWADHYLGSVYTDRFAALHSKGDGYVVELRLETTDEIDRLRAALQWYAKASLTDFSEDEWGKRARAALEGSK